MCKTKTKKEHFKIFVKECKKWIEKYGIGDWRYEYAHEKLDDSDAQCRYNTGQRGALISLNTEVETSCCETIENIVIGCAKHEVRESLLAVVRNMSLSGRQSSSDVDSEIHAIINRLEHAEN